MTTQPIDKNEWIDLGNYHFDKGIHEIQFEIPSAKNLLKNPADQFFPIVSTNSAMTKNLPLSTFDQFSHYKINFDYWIQKGTQVSINASSDIDQLQKNTTMPFFNKRLDADL